MSNERTRWLDDPRNVDKIYYGVWILCVLSVVADFFYEKYSYFPFEQWIGFHAAYGFVSCVGLVIAAKYLRRILKRSEDYYDH